MSSTISNQIFVMLVDASDPVRETEFLRSWIEEARQRRQMRSQRQNAEAA